SFEPTSTTKTLPYHKLLFFVMVLSTFFFSPSFKPRNGCHSNMASSCLEESLQSSAQQLEGVCGMSSCVCVCVWMYVFVCVWVCGVFVWWLCCVSGCLCLCVCGSVHVYECACVCVYTYF